MESENCLAYVSTDIAYVSISIAWHDVCVNLFRSWIESKFKNALYNAKVLKHCLMSSSSQIPWRGVWISGRICGANLLKCEEDIR